MRLFTADNNKNSISTLVITKDGKFFQVKPIKKFYESVDAWKASYPPSSAFTWMKPEVVEKKPTPANPDYAFLKKHTPPNLLYRGTYGDQLNRTKRSKDYYVKSFVPKDLWSLKYHMGGYTQKNGIVTSQSYGTARLSTIKEFKEIWAVKARPSNPAFLTDFLKYNGLTETMPFSALQAAMDSICERTVKETAMYKGLEAEIKQCEGDVAKYGRNTPYYTPGKNSFLYVKSKQNFYPLFYNDKQVHLAGETGSSLADLSIDHRTLYVMNRRTHVISPLIPEEEPGPLVLDQPWMMKEEQWIQQEQSQPTQQDQVLLP
jgi:hypothetical protein